MLLHVMALDGFAVRFPVIVKDRITFLAISKQSIGSFPAAIRGILIFWSNQKGVLPDLRVVKVTWVWFKVPCWILELFNLVGTEFFDLRPHGCSGGRRNGCFGGFGGTLVPTGRPTCRFESQSFDLPTVLPDLKHLLFLFHFILPNFQV